MKILAKNKAPKGTGVFDVLHFIVSLLIIIPLTVILLWLVVLILFFDEGDIAAGIILLSVTIFLIYMSLFFSDNYIRYYHAEETISVQSKSLVIDCTHSILRRHKSIPLTAIRTIKRNPSFNAIQTPVPDTLQVIYGKRRRYRFGIHMTVGQQDILKKKIQELIDYNYQMDSSFPINS